MHKDYFNINKTTSDILSVSQFNTLIKELVSSLGVFKVKGEITEMRISPNKGLFITLSDGEANLKVGGYAPNINGVKLIEQGMTVVVEGIADLYVPYGSFSIKALSIEAEGEGALAIAYQKLKESLEKEGLFANEHKQPLPRFITKIALLTGKDSAAYSDIIKILHEHKSGVEVLFYPVLVQGDKSVASIKAAFEEARLTDVDVIIITRGGGSLEDLKGFNSEELAQLLFTSPKPIIAGVGHEKDESICDFVADKKASTPSQAAYYIVERNQEFLDEIVSNADIINQQLINKVNKYESLVDQKIFIIENTLSQLFEQKQSQLISYERIIKSYDIKQVLKRGFALVQKQAKIVKSVAQLQRKDKLKTIFYDGEIYSILDKIIKLRSEQKTKK